MPYTDGGDADIYYEVHGDGTPIVLSAGMGGSGSFWTPQIAALAQRHTVIVYDHVGTGRSARPTGSIRSVVGMTDDVVTVMDHLGITAAHFVGHAIGGIVGLELAIRHPERLLSLSVVNGWGRADPFLRRCFEVRQRILNESGPKAYVRAQPLFLYPPQWISDNVGHLDHEEAAILANFPDVATMNRRIEMFLAFEGGERLATITVPTLLVASKDDALVPPHLTRQLADEIPDARVREVEWGAHAFTVVTPAIFNEMLLTFCHEVDA